MALAQESASEGSIEPIPESGIWKRGSCPAEILIYLGYRSRVSVFCAKEIAHSDSHAGVSRYVRRIPRTDHDTEAVVLSLTWQQIVDKDW